MLRIEGLTKRFHRRAVLDGLTLRIAPGERIALIGSNGAGKTTLFRCLLGHYRYEGRVVRGESEHGGRDAAYLARVAFVPQLPPPLRMPVGELMAFSAGSTGADPVRAHTVADRLGIDLEAVRHQPFWRLSGGQKQKILVTLALGRDADLLIFDEPAANLDPPARAAFIDILAERRDASMLIASHRLEEVAALVNRVIELDRGRVVLDDGVVDRLRTGGRRHCSIAVRQSHPAFADSLAAWGFEASGDGASFTGSFPDADSVRFLSMLSRYAGLLDRLSIDGESRPAP